MWSFYRPLIKRSFTIFLDKTDRVQTVIFLLSVTVNTDHVFQ
jgi:hypothetical protein